jgi:hypothetical protein
MNLQKILIEAFIVGICILLIGYIVNYSLSFYFESENKIAFNNWNKNYNFEIILFLTGFLGHIMFELTNINKYYCVNGNACKNYNV